MKKEVDVAIIGAGTAGLYAMSQVKKMTDNFVLINSGPYGTTCARVGCMPSKELIKIAEDFHGRTSFAEEGISGQNTLKADMPKVLEKVRSIRDMLVGRLVAGNIEPLGEKKIDARAEFIDQNTLKAGEVTVKAKKIIIATGSAPILPKEWEVFGDKILTTDTLFEQKDLPESLGIVGLGVIGLEIGQALSRLGIKVSGFNLSEHIGGLQDPQVNEKALEILSREIDMHLAHPAELSEVNGQIKIKSGDKEVLVDKVLASFGRVPNVKGIGLEKLGVKLDAKGVPEHNPETMQVGDLPIFIAGDVTGERQILHEAADEGRIAGYNAVHEITAYQRKIPLAIIFSDPNIAIVGKRYSEIANDPKIVTGEFNFSFHGRALIMGKNHGLLRLYAEKPSGKLVGAEMMIPSAEHIGHELAWAMEKSLTVQEMLKMPFYHPVIEEGLMSALQSLLGKLEIPKVKIWELHER